MQIHVIRQGETLWQLAQRYGTSISQITLLNQLEDPSDLVIGEALVIPNVYKEYVVERGDTLGTIAARFGTTTAALAQINNIADPNLIYVGELIELPYILHMVRQGETLWSIAMRYGLTIEQISEANQLSSPQIFVNQVLQIPHTIKPVKEINAYSTELNEQGRNEVLALGRYFTYLSPFMYSVKEDGSLTNLQDAPLLEAADRTETAPLLVLTNFRNHTFDSDLAATILRNQGTQQRLITNILETIRSKGYRGINIDFEYVYPEDRENYNQFLRRLVASLRPEGYLVSTAVAPKEREDQEGLLYEAHDYRAHGEIVDFVIIMTYEWGWAGGRPWAIAPINKVRDVLDYAVTAIPQNKIIMGIPLYGRDWKIPWEQGTIAKTISPKQAVQLAKKHHVAIQYNTTYEAPFFRYVDEDGQEHEVWFEDARSMQAKYDVMKEYNLRGGGFWVLGNPFPQNWPVLQTNINVRKI